MTNARHLSWRLLIIGMLNLLMFGHASVAQTTVELNRAYGFVVGDSVRQTIRLDPRLTDIDGSKLPKPGFRSSWLYLTDATIHEHSRAIELNYQVMATSDRIELIYLPILEVGLVNGSVERVDATPISISPLISAAPFTRTGFGLLRADRQPKPMSTVPFRNGLIASLLAAIAIAFLYLWRQRSLRSDAGPMYFGRASQAIDRLPRDESSVPDAYRLLHRAMDQTAGGSVFFENVDQFVLRHHAYDPQASKLRSFFSASSELFFGADAKPRQTLSELKALAIALARIERLSK